MLQEHTSVKEMWIKYLLSIGESIDSTSKTYESGFFCDNEKSAKSLADLVRKEIKKATASLHYSYEIENEPIPKVGDLSIITDWHGIAQCIIKTTKINIYPFKAVTNEFAAKEGEGDKTLSYWRKVHWDVFSRELKQYGIEPQKDMLVICEEFELVYKK
mgnify:CR=1 FL=1